MTDRVKVAIRVRPFSEQEKRANPSGKSIVQISNGMDGDSVTFEARRGTRKMAYQHCFSSVNPDSSPPPYASQETIFNTLGTHLVDSIMGGYNGCMFTYGQSGAGKTYSILGGEGEAEGIFPRVAKSLFQKLTTSSNVEVRGVYISMVDIYCEKIRDLLSDSPLNDQPGLEVRRNQLIGLTVQGMSKRAVKGWDDIDKLLKIAQSKRLQGEMRYGHDLKRSHMVYFLTVQQVRDGSTVDSQLAMVDLAGSDCGEMDENQSDQQVHQERFTAKNSLEALRQVLIARWRNAQAINYTQSKLTEILETHLAGDSRMVMLAALSPSELSQEETYKTLRYALTVKDVKAKPCVKQVDMYAKETELKRQMDRIRFEIEKAKYLGTEAHELDEDGKDELKEMQDALEHVTAEIESINLSFDEQLKKTEEWTDKAMDDNGLDMDEFASLLHIDPNCPRLVNISTDASLSGSVVYFIRFTENMIGTREGGDEVKIPLMRSLVDPNGVHSKHAVMHYEKASGNKSAKLTIRNAIDLSGGGGASALMNSPVTRVNGRLLTEPVELYNGDHIMLGKQHLFQVIHPGKVRGDSVQVGFLTREEAKRQIDIQRQQYEQKSQAAKLQTAIMSKASDEWKKRYLKMGKEKLVLNKELMKAQMREQQAQAELRHQQAQMAAKDKEVLEAKRKSVELDRYKNMVYEMKAENRMNALSEGLMAMDSEGWKKQLAQSKVRMLQLKKEMQEQESKNIDQAMTAVMEKTQAEYKAKMAELEKDLRTAQANSNSDKEKECQEKLDDLQSQLESMSKYRAAYKEMTLEQKKNPLALALTAKEGQVWKSRFENSRLDTLKTNMKMKKAYEEKLDDLMKDAMDKSQRELAAKITEMESQNKAHEAAQTKQHLAEVLALQDKMKNMSLQQKMNPTMWAAAEKEGWKKKLLQAKKRTLVVKRDMMKEMKSKIAEQMEKDRVEMEKKIDELKRQHAHDKQEEVKKMLDAALKEKAEQEEANKHFSEISFEKKTDSDHIMEAMFKGEAAGYKKKFLKSMKNTLELQKKMAKEKEEALEELAKKLLEEAKAELDGKTQEMERKNEEERKRNEQLMKELENLRRQKEELDSKLENNNEQSESMIGSIVGDNKDLQVLVANAKEEMQAKFAEEIKKQEEAHNMELAQLEAKLALSSANAVAAAEAQVKEKHEKETEELKVLIAQMKKQEEVRVAQKLNDANLSTSELIKQLNNQGIHPIVRKDAQEQKGQDGHKLIISIKQARDLMAKDIGGYSDPYCMLLAYDANGCTLNSWKTPTMQENLNPSWMQGFDMTELVGEAKRLHVQIWDADQVGQNDFMGEILIDFAAFEHPGTTEAWYDLKPRPDMIGKDNVSGSLLLTSSHIALDKDERVCLFLLNNDKPWKLNPQELSYLWDQLDTNSDGELTTEEALTLGKAWFKKQVKLTSKVMNRSEAEIEKRMLRNKALDRHMKEFVSSTFEEFFDVNCDGHVRKHEFMRRWNGFAKEQFKDPDDSLCVIL